MPHLGGSCDWVSHLPGGHLQDLSRELGLPQFLLRLAVKVAVTGRGGYFQDTFGRQN